MTQYDTLELAKILMDDCSQVEKLRRICEHIDCRDGYKVTNEVRDLLARVLAVQVPVGFDDLWSRIRVAIMPKPMVQPTGGEQIGGRS